MNEPFEHVNDSQALFGLLLLIYTLRFQSSMGKKEL